MKYTLKEVEDAIFRHNGILLSVASDLKIQYSAVRSRVAKNPRLQLAVVEARKQILDKAEKSLIECLDNREHWAITFALASLGKERGYGAQVPINVNLNFSEMTDEQLELLAEGKKLPNATNQPT